MQKCQCAIHNGTLERFVWSSLNYLSFFYFENWLFLIVVFLGFLLLENIYELSELNTLKPKKADNIFHISDQIKSRVPLLIGRCYHLK